MIRFAACAALALVACGRPVGDPHDAPPVVAIVAPSEAIVGVDVAFDSSASDDGTIKSLTWDFGDGATATGAQATHAFAAEGGYVVTLTAVDDGGASGKAELVLAVTGPKPSAHIVASTLAPAVGAAVSFDGSSSTPAPAGAAIASYAWSFGDGSHAESAAASYAFERAGTFHVKLTVTDADGAVDDDTVDVVVAPVDIAGAWTVVTSPSSYACSSYAATFPDAALAITTAADGSVTATGAGGRAYAGTLDGASLTLTGHITEDAGGCGTAPVDVTIHADVAGDAMSGTATAYFDLDVGCQCSAGFTFNATR